MTFLVDPHLLRTSAERGDRWYPYAAIFPIPEADTQRAIDSRLLVLHSMAGPNMTSIEAIGAYYRRDDIHTESTFALAFTGQMAQFVPIDVRADCQADANGFATSVETQDRGSALLATTPWSPEQCEQLAGLAAWQHMNPRCDLDLRWATAWNGRGIGPHRLFPEWSIWVGKTCPGDERVRQIPGIIARALELVAQAFHVEPTPTPTPTPQPTPTGGLMITWFQADDADAEFLAMCDDNGNALFVEWIATLDDIRRRNEHIAAGAAHNNGSLAAVGRFHNCILVGDYPVGDTKRTWGPADFAGRIPKAA